MGVTKIWAIKDSLSRVVGYAENAEKTEFSDMGQVLHYAQNSEKVTSGPEKTMYVTTLHCAVTTPARICSTSSGTSTRLAAT